MVDNKIEETCSPEGSPVKDGRLALGSMLWKGMGKVVGRRETRFEAVLPGTTDSLAQAQRALVPVRSCVRFLGLRGERRSQLGGEKIQLRGAGRTMGSLAEGELDAAGNFRGAGETLARRVGRMCVGRTPRCKE